jgi:hypothetical protein
MSSKKCKTGQSFSNGCEASRPQAGASRARSGERKARKGNIFLVVPLALAYKAGLVGYLPASGERFFWILFHCRLHDIIGTEPGALNRPSDSGIHTEQVGDSYSPFEFACGPSEREVGRGMEDFLPGFKDF